MEKWKKEKYSKEGVDYTCERDKLINSPIYTRFSRPAPGTYKKWAVKTILKQSIELIIC